MELEFDSQILQTDYKAIARYVLYTARKAITIISIIMLAVLIYCYYPYGWMGLAIVAVIFCIYLFIMKTIQTVAMKKMLAPQLSKISHTRVELNSDEMILSDIDNSGNTSTSSTTKVSNFIKVVETDQFVFLHVSNQLFNIIKKSPKMSTSDRQLLSQILKTYSKDYKDITKKTTT